MTVLTGCESASPTPRQSSDDFLKRREMAREAEEVATQARESGDFALESAALTLLIELWPDLPEAKAGGRWRRAHEKARQMVDVTDELEVSRARGTALRTSIEHAETELSGIERTLEKVVSDEGRAEFDSFARARDASQSALHFAHGLAVREALLPAEPLDAALKSGPVRTPIDSQPVETP